jgi:lipid II:glycine glycyltransferase (peptidoglycan interpeptide bridge formation enzyme)
LVIKLIDPFTDKRWDEFVLQHPEGTIFHHSAWAKVLQERYQTKPSYYAVEDNQGQITGIAPFFLVSTPFGKKRLVCLPCSEYCFPLARNTEDIENLIAYAEEEVKTQHISYLEIRGLKGVSDSEKLALKEHPYYLNHVTVLEPDFNVFKNKLSRHTRYHINRGEREMVDISEAHDESDLEQFHQLTCNTRRRLNLLPWPYGFLRSIFQHLILPGYGFLLLAKVNGKTVSGGLFLSFKDKVLNKINTTDAQYIQLRTNYLLTWKALERACRESYRYFDFGVSNPENTGLIKYKKHWESVETVLPYYYYPNIRGFNSVPETSFLYRAHTSINRVLPDFALKMAADILYKRMG